MKLYNYNSNIFFNQQKKQKHCILYSVLYNKKMYNLMMAVIEPETCSC